MFDFTPLKFSRYRKIVFLTGAGISVASGLPTYRGKGGLWNDPEHVHPPTVHLFERDPHAIWKQFGPMRRAALEAQPNAAHTAIAELERRGGAEVHVITQNVDELHKRGGAKNVVELHGTLMITRCSNTECTLEPYRDEAEHAASLPLCPECRAPLRPDIVLFGESIPAAADLRAKQALRDVDLFIAVGTSALVFPAAAFVKSAQFAGADTVFLNPEPPPDEARVLYDRVITANAEEVLPALFR